MGRRLYRGVEGVILCRTSLLSKAVDLAGTQFLETTRDEPRWEKVKDYIQKRALPMTPPIIIKVAENLIEKAL